LGLIEELVDQARERARQLPFRENVPRPSGTSLLECLRGKARLDVIAEFKQASPSLGAIAERDVESQVKAYSRAGASAVSVLTEPTRFRGSYDDLERAARSTNVPILMKDFVVDPAQVREAAFRGARGALLIVRCLSSTELDELASACREYGLTPLVECHRPEEVERALDVERAVIGVNNRDLDTLEIDRGLARRLLAEIPTERVVVAESGYESSEDVQDVRGIADAVLVGSALMKREDPAQLIRELRG
jgi:indole-3-glycerol phosphate synthase